MSFSACPSGSTQCISVTDIQTTMVLRSKDLSLPGTKVPWNFRSLELSFPGTFASWNFHSLPRTVALRVLKIFCWIGLTIVNINVRYHSQVLLITTVNK